MIVITKDIILNTDHKVKAIMQKFFQTVFQDYPFLLQTQGSKVFHFIRLIKDSELAIKIKVLLELIVVS